MSSLVPSSPCQLLIPSLFLLHPLLYPIQLYEETFKLKFSVIPAISTLFKYIFNHFQQFSATFLHSRYFQQNFSNVYPFQQFPAIFIHSGHFQPFQAISSCFKPFSVISCHFQPYQTFKPFQDISRKFHIILPLSAVPGSSSNFQQFPAIPTIFSHF